jgi:hypothetical protein
LISVFDPKVVTVLVTTLLFKVPFRVGQHRNKIQNNNDLEDFAWCRVLVKIRVPSLAPFLTEGKPSFEE